MYEKYFFLTYRLSSRENKLSARGQIPALPKIIGKVGYFRISTTSLEDVHTKFKTIQI